MSPALPKLVPSPGAPRSTSATRRPRSRRCSAADTPTMPAPRTMTSKSIEQAQVRCRANGERAGARGSPQRGGAAREPSAPDRRSPRADEPMNRCTDESAGLIGGPAKEQPAETRGRIISPKFQNACYDPDETADIGVFARGPCMAVPSARAAARLHLGPHGGRRRPPCSARSGAARVAVRRSAAINPRRQRGMARRVRAKGRSERGSGCGAAREKPAQPRVRRAAEPACFP